MSDLRTPLGLAFASAVLAAGLATWRSAMLAERTRRRLEFPAPETTAEEPEADAPPPTFVERHPLVPWLAGLAVALALAAIVHAPFMIAVAALAIVGSLGTMIDRGRVQSREARIESQLADAIDLMVGSLRAGSSLLESLDAAAREAEEPLRAQLRAISEKVRLGEDPHRAIRELTERVPLHSFRLFALTLGVNWEVGGSLAPSLGSVGRAVRDRTELCRRVRAQSTQARVSVVGVLGVTYFLALLFWRSDPARMEEFLRTSLGTNAVGLALVMQAAGLVWMGRMSEIET